MKNALCLRVGGAVLAALAVLALLFAGPAACSSSPNHPSEVAATTPAHQTLAIALKVSNTHLGNALPSDFKLSVSYEGAAGSSATLDGASSPLEVSVPHGANYKVSVVPLDGYSVALSAGCAGAIREPATCTVTASDVEVTCDKALWDPVYTKDRLRILSACEVATGVVRATEFERDGDLEVWITPDAGYRQLMRPGNQYSFGWLVVEVPCQGPIVQQDAMGTCDRFTGQKIRVPQAGEHVIVAAPWVEDRGHHAWGELHGAQIVKLPR